MSRNSSCLGLFRIAGNRTEDTVDDEVHEVDDHDDKTDFDLMQSISLFCVRGSGPGVAIESTFDCHTMGSPIPTDSLNECICINLLPFSENLGPVRGIRMLLRGSGSSSPNCVVLIQAVCWPWCCCLTQCGFGRTMERLPDEAQVNGTELEIGSNDGFDFYTAAFPSIGNFPLHHRHHHIWVVVLQRIIG